MNVFILHPSSLQTCIWKKICNSQQWTTSIFAQDSDLRQAVVLSEEMGESLADVILLAESIASDPSNDLCQWLKGRLQLVPFILLADAAPQSLTVTQKQLAKAKGAYKLLPDFQPDTIALDAVKGLSSVASLQNLSIDSKALQQSIIELKPDLMNAPIRSVAVGNGAKNRSDTRLYRGQTYKVETASAAPQKSEPRRYRGQQY